jgi:phage FluMu protein Com
MGSITAAPTPVPGATWHEARCTTDRCGTRANGRGKLLLRYTGECFESGGVIEIKCPDCNTVRVIDRST